MRRGLFAIVAAALIAVAPATADAKKRHHKPSGVAGVVLNGTCPGACMEPAPPEPLYTGPVTITVARASDGQQVASQAISEGKFRFRVKRGFYDISSVPPNPPTCEPTPETVCPMYGAEGKAIIAPCLAGETQRVRVRRHKFTHIELHVRNVCIV